MQKFELHGIKCISCVEKIKAALDSAGFEHAVVYKDPPSIVFETGPRIALDTLQKAVRNAGDYTVSIVSLSKPLNFNKSDQPDNDERLMPLIVIVLYILGGVLLRAYISSDFSFHSIMTNFMGGFFVVFSMFKFLNLSGFADAFSTYDIIAARSRAYALSYPFIELILGVGYFLGIYPLSINLVTVLIMSIGSIGVYKALSTKRKFQCACLGTALKLPMTKVTLIEDVTMGIMALLMIFHTLGV